MNYKVCCVYDRIAQIYGVPNFTNSKGSTVRAFADMINKPDQNNQFYEHPDDYDLYYLGEFDDATGIFSLEDKAELLARGANVKITKA
nr:MAG: nonstructural protein [Microvirus sp.]